MKNHCLQVKNLLLVHHVLNLLISIKHFIKYKIYFITELSSSCELSLSRAMYLFTSFTLNSPECFI